MAVGVNFWDKLFHRHKLSALKSLDDSTTSLASSMPLFSLVVFNTPFVSLHLSGVDEGLVDGLVHRRRFVNHLAAVKSDYNIYPYGGCVCSFCTCVIDTELTHCPRDVECVW
jgi:hypothetical protein